MKRALLLITLLISVLFAANVAFADEPVLYNNGAPFVVTCEEDSTIDLKPYLGAYVTAYANGNGQITEIKEVRSEFIEGRYRDLQNEYNFNSAMMATDYRSFLNSDVDPVATHYNAEWDRVVKLAVKLNGLSVYEVYSMQRWEADGTFKASAYVQEEIAVDKGINGYAFALNDYDAIDPDSFSIMGRNSLSALQPDDIVTVYLHHDNTIAKIEVGTARITGQVEQINTNQTRFTISGSVYQLNMDASISAADLYGLMLDGKTATFYLDYSGYIYSFEIEDDSVKGFGVVLATGSEPGTYGNMTYYIRMLKADGSIEDFVVNSNLVDGNMLNVMYPAGSLVSYTLDANGAVSELLASDNYGVGSFDANGIYNGTVLASDAVVFSFEGFDYQDEDSYTVLNVSDLYGADFTEMRGFQENGEYKAVLVFGLRINSNDYAFFVSEDGTNADGRIWTALYKGTVASLTVDAGMAPAVTTVDAAALYQISFNKQGVVTSLTAMAPSMYAADVSTATSVSGFVFRDGTSSRSLDTQVVVYMYDGDWSVKDPSSLQGRAGSFESIVLFDTDMDGDFDIALAYKPSNTLTYDYAILLNFSVGTGSNSSKGFVTLLTADLSEHEYEVASSVSGQIADGVWEHGFAPGSLVRYAVNAQVIVTSMETGSAADPSGSMQFEDDASYNGIFMGTSPVIFSYTGGDISNGSSYDVLLRYDLSGACFTALDFFAENSIFKAIKVTGFTYPAATGNYAVVLATGSESDHYGHDSAYIKLFEANGTVKEFAVSDNLGDAHNLSAFYPAGSFVRYEVNDRDKITLLEMSSGMMSAGAFDENGLSDWLALTATTKVFCFEGYDANDPDSYSVLTPDELKGTEFASLSYFSENGDILAAMVTGLSIRDDRYAVFYSKDAVMDDGFVWTALFGGTVRELIADHSIAPDVYASNAVTLYKLTFSKDGVVTAITPCMVNSVAADTSRETSVTGAVFRDGSNTMYSLDSTIAVYLYDTSAGKWSVGDNASLAGKTGSFNSILLIDTDSDGDYDIAIAEKPFIQASAGYAILLEKGANNSVGFARLLLSNGSVATYDVSENVSGAIENGTWTYDLDPGILIGFTLDADNVIDSIDAGFIVAQDAPFVFDGAAIYDGVKADPGIIVFSYSGTNPGSASSYTILPLDSIRNAAFATMDYIGESGRMHAAKITGLTTGAGPAETFRVEKDCQEEIAENKTLNGYAFVLNSNGEIDTDSFILLGHSSLSEIEGDDIATVYLYSSGAYTGKISKIEVGTEQIDGTVTRVSVDGTVFTIDGESYELDEFSYCGPFVLSDSGTFYLTYAGKIFDFEVLDDTVSGFAVVLAVGSDVDKYGVTTPYIKLFEKDGTVREYAVKSEIPGITNSGSWDYSIAAGTLIKYDLNQRNVIANIILSYENYAVGEFDVNGLYNSYALDDKTIAFICSGNDMGDPDSYDVVEVNTLKSSAFDAMSCFVKNGTFRAVLVSGLSVNDNKLAIFARQDAVSAAGKIYTALYGGVVTDLTLRVDIAPQLYVPDAAVPMYKLTFDKTGVVTRAIDVITTVLAADVNGATSVNGSVFKDGSSRSYSLDQNVEVYAYSETDEEWTAKGKTILSGKAGSFSYISLIDTDSDADYDIVLVSKPSHIHDLVKTEAAEPTCTEAGNSEYWTCTLCHKYYSDANAVNEIAADSWVIAALGHAYEIEYVWADDNSSVTATAVCGRDASHTVTETVNTAAEVTKEPTTEEFGETTYTAAFTDDAFTTQTKVVANIEPLQPVYEKGDADGDGKVGTRDRILLSRYLAGWTGVAEIIKDMDALDINRDGKVNAKDRVILSRYLANWGAEYDKYFEVPSLNGNYGILLDTGADHTSAGPIVGYAKLFLADGTTKEFQVEPSVSGEISGAGWAIPYVPGSLVYYVVDTSDIIVSVTTADVTGTGQGQFSESGVFDSVALENNAIAFSYNGEDATDADNYAAISAVGLYGKEFTNLDYFASEGIFKAVKVSGLPGRPSYALFVDHTGSSKDGEIWTVLYDGTVRDFTVQRGLNPQLSTTTSFTFYSIAMIDDVVTGLNAEPCNTVFADLSTDPTASTSVSNGMFSDGNMNYSLDADLCAYIYDESDDAWTSYTARALVGRKRTFSSIALIDVNSDSMYDIAVVSKP